MNGPRLVGSNGVELRPATLEDFKTRMAWLARPEPTRFWGPRHGEWTEEKVEERYRKEVESATAIGWAIAYNGETVGFTGIFHINWITRQGESGIFIGRHDLYGRGIASEAVRLRTRYAWSGLRLHRVYNWIAPQNRGSLRANQKAGYRQIGLFERYAYRSGEWIDDWMGEIFPEQVFTPEEPPATLAAPEEGGDESLPREPRVRPSSRDRADAQVPATKREEASQVSFTDKTLTCKDCGQEFIWTSGEQEFYQSRGLMNEPGRCPTCRAARRASGGGAGYGGGRGMGGPREFFTATCSNCGGEARVPFQPRGDKPVYCSSCFEQVRPSASRGSRY